MRAFLHVLIPDSALPSSFNLLALRQIRRIDTHLPEQRALER